MIISISLLSLPASILELFCFIFLRFLILAQCSINNVRLAFAKIPLDLHLQLLQK